jgi:large subunit ribosomal protein L24
MNRIRQGDEVIVIAGKDKGKRGNVTRVMPDGRIVVTDVNMVKRHTKPNPNRGVAGGGRLQDTGRRSQGAVFQIYQ